MAVVAGFHCDVISCELARRCVRRGAAEASRSSEAQRVCTVVVTRSFSPWSYSIAGSNSDPDRGAEYCDEHVCLSARDHISGTTRPIFAKFFVHVTYGRGSVLSGGQTGEWALVQEEQIGPLLTLGKFSLNR